MIRYFRQFFFIFSISLFLIYTPLLLYAANLSDYTAKNGSLDLNGWDPETQGTVVLDGEWRFFWKKLIDPQKEVSDQNETSDGVANLPCIWNSTVIKGKKLGPEGYATYILIIHHNLAGKELGFSIREMSSAYRLYADGQLVCANGNVGTSLKEETPEYRPVISSYTPAENTTRLVLHVSNHSLKEGGPFKKIVMGNFQALSKNGLHRKIIDLVLIGLILSMGLYHLSLFILFGRFRSPFYFGLFCLIISLRTALTNDRVFHTVFPGLSWETLIAVEYLTFYLAVPAFLFYFRSLYPNELSKKICNAVLFICLIFSLVVIFSKPMVFSYTLQFFQAFTIMIGVYIIYALIQALRNKRLGSMVVVFGFVVFFITVIYDILGANYIIQSDFSIHIGLFIFIFSQAYILSLRFSATMNRVERQKNEIEESHQQFKNSRIALILGLAKLAEYRDEDTGSHLERIREYTRSIAQELAKNEKYKDYITEDYINDLYQSAILHDIGKIGIPDAILLKPGKLTEEEFEVIKTHTTIGGDALSEIESKSRVRSFLALGKDIAYFHHEKWNGKGYPRGLKGEEIPLSARITAIADVYDALTSERPYKDAFPHQKAVDIIVKDSGTHFDPEIIEVFKKLEPQFEQIRKNFFD